MTPVPAAAVISPTECPAPTDTWVKASEGFGKSSSSAARPDATISGWAIAVSRIVSASDSVPCSSRSMPATVVNHCIRSWTEGSSNHGASSPGACEPWPGQTIASTSSACHVAVIVL
ncbi:MAG: hypothetical protein BWY91_01508 [bacterium ADurb.BinA028]|nr:MAG: hypothetical protein BWY91_01508 [bacterium ADurb.BinA028]